MKIASYFIIAGVALTLSAGCRSTRADKDSSATPVTTWQYRPIVIDGSDADWVKPLPYYDKKEKVSYSITNDKENLYVLLSAKGEDEQHKTLSGGMTLWINNQAQKANSDALGIGFPTGSRPPSRESSLMQQARPQDYQNQNHRNSVADDLASYSLYGFSKDETVQNFDAGDTNQAGVRVKIGFNSLGELIYEASVPLSSIYPQNGSHNFAGKSLAVGLYIEGIPPGEEGRRRGGGGGGGVSFDGGLGMGSYGSGMGLGMSIGSGAFGGGGGRGPDRQLFEQTQLWQVVPLARN